MWASRRKPRREKNIMKLLQFAYAASVAVTQAITTFTQVRAEQETLARMTDKEVKELLNDKVATKAPIGFVNNMKREE
tara:strand:- start:390 stop:623 length:234 start_codon:yes stop_codon:yes gene_type:complete